MLNLVQLLGLVAARPVLNHSGDSCSLLVVTSTPSGEQRQRHRIVAAGRLAPAAAGLSVGRCVFVGGSLRRDERHRVTTVARELWAVGEPPGEPVSPEEAQASHASPREHQRAGHWRRINRGTPRERLCWVRATVVARGSARR